MCDVLKPKGHVKQPLATSKKQKSELAGSYFCPKSCIATREDAVSALSITMSPPPSFDYVRMTKRLINSLRMPSQTMNARYTVDNCTQCKHIHLCVCVCVHVDYLDYGKWESRHYRLLGSLTRWWRCMMQRMRRPDSSRARRRLGGELLQGTWRDWREKEKKPKACNFDVHAPRKSIFLFAFVLYTDLMGFRLLVHSSSHRNKLFAFLHFKRMYFSYTGYRYTAKTWHSEC